MDRERIAREYFDWLYDQVVSSKGHRGPFGYTKLCELMYRIPFKALVPHDDNRLSDGAGLLDDFLRLNDGRVAQFDAMELLLRKTTIFEVLVALAIRAEYMVDRPRKVWFLIFLRNLGLSRYTDDVIRTADKRRINLVLNRFNDRTYWWNGRGGLFPLKDGRTDQREIELWYQMSEYINENKMY
jgi:hypothetical protein